jgi:hypothetical protein
MKQEIQIKLEGLNAEAVALTKTIRDNYKSINI